MPGASTTTAWLEIRLEDGTDISVYESLPWPSDGPPLSGTDWSIPDVVMPAASPMGQFLRRSAFVQTTRNARSFVHDTMAAWDRHEQARALGDKTPLALGPAGVLLQILLMDRDHPELLSLLYFHSFDAGGGRRYQSALLRQLADDAHLGPAMRIPAISVRKQQDNTFDFRLIVRMLAAVLAQDEQRGLGLVRSWLPPRHVWPADGAETIRLAFAGVGLEVPEWIDTI